MVADGFAVPQGIGFFHRKAATGVIAGAAGTGLSMAVSHGGLGHVAVFVISESIG